MTEAKENLLVHRGPVDNQMSTSSNPPTKKHYSYTENPVVILFALVECSNLRALMPLRKAAKQR